MMIKKSHNDKKVPWRSLDCKKFNIVVYDENSARAEEITNYDDFIFSEYELWILVFLIWKP